MRSIYLIKDFSDCPSGRYRSDGADSGEAFREDHLKPALAAHDRISVDLNGADCLPPGFLDEAFGMLAKDMGKLEFERRVQIILDDDATALRKLRQSIDLRAS